MPAAPGLPLPAGLTVRPLAYASDGSVVDADLDVVTDVVHRSERAALGAPDATRDEIREMLSTPDVVRSESYVVQTGGRAVAAGWIEADEVGRELWTETFLDPAVPGAE